MIRARQMPTLALILCIAIAQTACVGYTVRPPEIVADPAHVFVIDYGDTSRLWLPEDTGGFTEWGYGDWRWYANDQTNLLYGIIVLTWPTSGTLGMHVRQTGPWGSDGVLLSDLAGYAQLVHEIDVERAKMEALRAELHERYESQRSTEIYNERRQMSFVKDQSSYWMGHQSTTVMAGWLREMGCKASGYSLRANYHVRPPGRTLDLRGE